MEKKFSVKELAKIGVLAALVFAASWIQINIPTPVDNTRLHLGNVMCLLSGLILGAVPGGFAAGIGSMFFDLTNPLYTKDALFTFAFKFCLAFVCGKIAWSNGFQGINTKRNIAAAIFGMVSYIILYLGKTYVEQFYFNRLELETVLITVAQKGIVSSANAIIAIIIAVPLAVAIREALAIRR